MKRKLLVGLIALGAITSAVACSLDDFVDFGGVIGVDDGASEGTFKSASVDGSEDTRIELKTRAAITVPKGAVDTMVEIGMERPSDKEAVTLVKSLKDYQGIVSAPYVLTPHGTKFKGAVTVEIPITKQSDKKLVMGWLEDENDKVWKRLGEPVIKDGIAKIEMDHFSVVILLEEDRANLASDDPGTPASTSSGGDVERALDAGFNADEPPASYDAGRATASGGTTDLPPDFYDAGWAFPVRDAEPAPYPFPYPDAEVYVPKPGYDASTEADASTSAYPSDAGAAAPYDAGSASDADVDSSKAYAPDAYAQ